MKLTAVEEKNYLRIALILGIITVVYNLAEGAVSTIFGYADDTLALFGFGIDSFVEVMSGIGIVHMVIRMRRSPVSGRDRFERQALYITGAGFFILAAGLVVGALLNIIFRVKPGTTVPGIIISSVSILTMWALYLLKLRAGRRLDSAPIMADANCTKTCLYLSFILLASSGLYALARVPYVDSLGALGIAWFAFREGRESVEKARSGSLTCSCENDCRE